MRSDDILPPAQPGVLGTAGPIPPEFVDREVVREVLRRLSGKKPDPFEASELLDSAEAEIAVARDPGATKHDGGKPDLSLLLMFGLALKDVGAVGTFGAAKYSRGGWQACPDGINRYTAALLRHVMSENTELLDPESGVRHATHAAWNALARLELMLREAKSHGTK